MIKIKYIKIILNCQLKTWLFPDGGVGVKLDSQNFKYLYEEAKYQTIVARTSKFK